MSHPVARPVNDRDPAPAAHPDRGPAGRYAGGIKALIGGRPEWQLVADTSDDGRAAFETRSPYSADIAPRQ